MVSTNRVPAIVQPTTTTSSLEEREILYKLLFEMKSDLNDLKSVVREVVKQSDISLEKESHTATLKPFVQEDMVEAISSFPGSTAAVTKTSEREDDTSYIIREKDSYDDAVVVEENLSLEEMERQYITKALLKHGGRRRDAARELGISERTLYRKIKEYDLQ